MQETSAQIFSLSGLRRKRTFNVFVSQSLPGRLKTTVREKALAQFSNMKLEVISGFPDLGKEDVCSQCTLTNFLIEKIETIIKDDQNRHEVDGFWIEPPTELDVTQLTDALERISELRIHSVLTAIDVSQFLKDFTEDQSFEERFAKNGESPQDISRAALQEPVLETLINQIECCDVLVLDGTESESVQAILQTLAPRSKILKSDELHSILQNDSALFQSSKTYRSAAWQILIHSTPLGTTPQCFRSRRPFHPTRLNALIENWPEAILRSAGTIWIASHNSLSIRMSQVGPAGFFFSPEGYWLATLPQLETAMMRKGDPELERIWDRQFGDRMTEIGFVSLEPLPEDWVRALEDCVLTDFEMRLNWNNFENPFPTLEETDSEELESDHEEACRLQLVPKQEKPDSERVQS